MTGGMKDAVNQLLFTSRLHFAVSRLMWGSGVNDGYVCSFLQEILRFDLDCQPALSQPKL